jgi:hypothetical protein
VAIVATAALARGEAATMVAEAGADKQNTIDPSADAAAHPIAACGTRPRS